MPDLPDELDKILAAVAGGALSPSAAAGRLRNGEVRYLDEFAVLDLGRQARKGVPEVVYAPGKTPEQVARICETLLDSTERVIVSGSSPEVTAELRRSLPGTPLRGRRTRALGRPHRRHMRGHLGRAGSRGGGRGGQGDGRCRQELP